MRRVGLTTDPPKVEPLVTVLLAFGATLAMLQPAGGVLVLGAVVTLRAPRPRIS